MITVMMPPSEIMVTKKTAKPYCAVSRLADKHARSSQRYRMATTQYAFILQQDAATPQKRKGQQGRSDSKCLCRRKEAIAMPRPMQPKLRSNSRFAQAWKVLSGDLGTNVWPAAWLAPHSPVSDSVVGFSHCTFCVFLNQ